jgi:hypothetical protein
MSNGDYTDNTVLKANGECFYVGLYEEDVNQDTFKFMGKLVINKHGPNAKSYKPSNTTSGFILYLLFREDGEGISHGELIKQLDNKFQGVIVDQVDALLRDLEKRINAITREVAGASTPNPDPCGICRVPLRLKFENPSIANANDSDVRYKMAYGRGQYFYTIRR